MNTATGLVALSIGLVAARPAAGADLRVMSGGAPQEVLAVLTPQFESQSGRKVTFTFAVITALQQRLAAGEKTDMVLMPVPVIDNLIKAGTLQADGRATLGTVGISVIVREGAARPDISTPDHLRQSLLNAASIVHATPTATPSGAHMARVLGELGIAEAVQKKVTHRPALDGGVDLVASGEAELGFYPTSEVAHVKGISIVGPLPPKLQLNTVYGAAVTTDSAAPQEAAAFIRFLSDPAHRKEWTHGGFEPPGS